MLVSYLLQEAYSKASTLPVWKKYVNCTKQEHVWVTLGGILRTKVVNKRDIDKREVECAVEGVADE